jgi:hypothetical protein
MPKTHNKTGRSNGDGNFIKLPHYIFDCFAWSQLSPYARCAWLEFVRLYGGPGTNNGTLAMSSRRLAERLSVSKNCAARAIHQLITYGFLEVTRQSSFDRKRQSAEYRLTHLPCDLTGELPTRAFMKLAAQKGNGKDEGHSPRRDTIANFHRPSRDPHRPSRDPP